MTKNLLSKYRSPIIMWCAVTLYFAFQFILRLFPGILREDIMQRFAIDTIAFGNLAGYYYLGYAGMQIPLGYLLDRFNIRFVVFISIITASIGALTFCYAKHWDFVLLGRFLIGTGSAVAFLSVAKVIKSFFPQKYHALMIAFSFTFGLTGAVIGGEPTKIIFDSFGYDTTLKLIASIAVFIAFIVIFVNDKKIEKFEYNEEKNKISFVDTLKLVFNPTLLLIGLCGGLMVGSLEGFADVWGIAFLNHVYGYSENESIRAISVIYTGMCFGGPVLAFFAQKLKSNIIVIFFTGIITSIIFIILFATGNLDYPVILFVMFILGILCCYQVLVFTLTTEIVKKSSAGLAIAIINCINMSFGHLFHVLISNIMQANWDGSVNEKAMPIYSHSTYILALSPIPILCMLGTMGFIYLCVMHKKGKLKLVG